MSKREKVENLFGKINEVEGNDRLALITRIVVQRKVVEAALQSLVTLEDPNLSQWYEESELAEIDGMMGEVVASARRLIEWFLVRSEMEVPQEQIEPYVS